jgi:hypothetical protein
MNIKEFTLVTYKEKTDTSNAMGFFVRPRIQCVDGFIFSVQGGEFNYSIPSEHSKEFTHMEIGFTSHVEESILEFAEDDTFPTETVYYRVDIEIIQKIIDKHGGIDIEKTFQ